ncbi:cupin domain-containing protein [Algoriphagus machipongonensis]|uniref:Cupin domain protein n=1 Tax=Algoriphagus machipongonensis TaxID=388413 RepID=A3I2J5_9BACT|nr:cupin domain-containing protein [Algoriphagus machipongonensis]EAZ79299.1 putative cupin domain protein [Algoriphagus machipongonensis]
MERRKFIKNTTFFGSALLIGCNGNPSETESIKQNVNADTLYIPPNDKRIKLSYEQTGDQLTTVELKLPPKMCGPAPHSHDELDEIVRVLSGTLTVMVEDSIVKIPEGGWHFRPRKKIHGFWNEEDEPVHFIEIYPNQNFDVMLQRIWDLRNRLIKSGISLDSKAAWEKVDEIQKEWGIKMYHERRKEIIDKYGLRG